MWRFLEILVGAALVAFLALVVLGLTKEDDPTFFLGGSLRSPLRTDTLLDRRVVL